MRKRMSFSRGQRGPERGNDFVPINRPWMPSADEVLIKDEDNVAVNNSIALYWLAEGDLKKLNTCDTGFNMSPENVAGLVTRGSSIT